MSISLNNEQEEFFSSMFNNISIVDESNQFVNESNQLVQFVNESNQLVNESNQLVNEYPLLLYNNLVQYKNLFYMITDFKILRFSSDPFSLYDLYRYYLSLTLSKLQQFIMDQRTNPLLVEGISLYIVTNEQYTLLNIEKAFTVMHYVYKQERNISLVTIKMIIDLMTSIVIVSK